MSFSRYNTEDSVISAETVIRGLWSEDNNTLSSFLQDTIPKTNNPNKTTFLISVTFLTNILQIQTTTK
jgi:hypothetical protein